MKTLKMCMVAIVFFAIGAVCNPAYQKVFAQEEIQSDIRVVTHGNYGWVFDDAVPGGRRAFKDLCYAWGEEYPEHDTVGLREYKLDDALVIEWEIVFEDDGTFEIVYNTGTLMRSRAPDRGINGDGGYGNFRVMKSPPTL